MDKSIKIWDSTTFRLLKVLDKSRHAGHGTSVNKVLWLAIDEVLITCSDDRTLGIWSIKT
jgi:WD40 repeat protein